MKDIEDLGDGGHCSRYIAPPKRGTPQARLHNLSGIINHRRAGRLGTHGEDCYTCVAKCDTAADAEAEPPSPKQLETRWAQFPIVNPYGDGVHLDDLVEMFAADSASTVNLIVGQTDHDHQQLAQARKHLKMAEEAVRQTGKVPEAMQPPSNGDPYVQRGQDADITSPTFDALLQGMVENARDESKVIHDASPTVLNAHATYADSLRFEAEQQVLFRESPVIVGLSGDLPNPNDYRRFEVAGKSMLLTRDSTGKFRAFENACRHRGMELVSSEAPSGNKRVHVCPYHAWSYGSDGSLMSIPFEEGFTDEAGAHAAERGGLVALPAAERAGLLWVMATKVDDATFEQLLGEVLPPELESELELYGLGEARRVISQDMTIDANWKLPTDTFCESYHFTKLHPGLNVAFMPNTSVFRTFQPSNPEGLTRSSCMTLGNTRTRVLAAGVPEQDWGPPLDYITNVYHLAPNTVLLCGGGGGFTMSQHWPAGSADHCTAELSQWSKAPPPAVMEADSEAGTGPTAAAMDARRRGFGFLMDLFVGEDFQILPKMYANFRANQGIEVILGRHEPCLADRHRFYSEAVARDAGRFAEMQSSTEHTFQEDFAVNFADGGGGGE